MHYLYKLLLFVVTFKWYIYYKCEMLFPLFHSPPSALGCNLPQFYHPNFYIDISHKLQKNILKHYTMSLGSVLSFKKGINIFNLKKNYMSFCKILGDPKFKKARN